MTSSVATTDSLAFPSVDETYAVFVHLNAEKSPLYRAVLSVFVARTAIPALLTAVTQQRTAELEPAEADTGPSCWNSSKPTNAGR
jgi:hypothetical protein